MGIKAKFRAWLIDLVRDAIRSEMAVIAVGGDLMATVPNPTYFPVHGGLSIQPALSYSDALAKASVSPQSTPIEPSFEQMQAEALKAQEKYYEPA